MDTPNAKKTRAEVLAEINSAHERRHKLGEELLTNIKTRRPEIEAKLLWFKREEPDLVYRFYHQSFKVFIMTSLIKSANELFESLAPESTVLNSWYATITQTAISKKFDDETNQAWFEETLPVTQGFWHAKYFLEQMIASADELDEAPQMLPSGWAAVLYLYNLR